jgi:hypothetical protein
MPVLVSFAVFSPWMNQYLPSYPSILVDSGAFSEFSSGAKVDVVKYVEWARSLKCVDAYAGLDDISGDWRRSFENYKHGGFPTIHEADPPEILDDLLAISAERGDWIGIGLTPPRSGKEDIVRRILDRIPEGYHVHGWALRQYTHLPRLDSVDSTNWWRDAMKLRTLSDTKHLTYGECLEVVVKRYQRWARLTEKQEEKGLFVA